MKANSKCSSRETGPRNRATGDSERAEQANDARKLQEKYTFAGSRWEPACVATVAFPAHSRPGTRGSAVCSFRGIPGPYSTRGRAG